MVKSLVKQAIVWFGFLNGILFSLGINPQQEIIKFLQPILSNIHPIVQAIFIILPTILTITTIVTILKIYHKGGIIGAGAVALAFLAGALLLRQWMIATILLIIAVIIGNITIKDK